MLYIIYDIIDISRSSRQLSVHTVTYNDCIFVVSFINFYLKNKDHFISVVNVQNKWREKNNAFLMIFCFTPGIKLCYN